MGGGEVGPSSFFLVSRRLLRLGALSYGDLKERTPRGRPADPTSKSLLPDDDTALGISWTHGPLVSHSTHSHAHSFSGSLTPPEALHLSLCCVLFCVVVCLYKHSGNKNPLVATALGSQTPARAYVQVGEFARPLRWKQSGATSLWVPEERRRLCELTEACRCWRTPPVDGARRLRHHCRTPARRRCALPAERSLS